MTFEHLTTEIDTFTNQIIERASTEAEIKVIEEAKKEEIARENELLAKIKTRQNALAKLAALGLTQEEIDAL